MVAKRVIKKLYLIGDSLTQKGSEADGFVVKLAEKYIRRLDVINRGFSGYTTEHMRIIISELLKNDNLPEKSIHTAVILLTSNDCVHKEVDDRSVPVTRSRENLKFIVEQLREQHVENIVILTPPPINGPAWDEFLKTIDAPLGCHTNAGVIPYVEMVREFAKKENLHLVDINATISAVKDWEENFCDGLHFNAKGNSLVFDALTSTLDPLLADIGMPYPEWSDIDNKNPAHSLA